MEARARSGPPGSPLMNSRALPSVLLLDGASAASLAFVRSLGRAGVAVTAADFRAQAPARVSRYCRRFLLYPSPLDAPERFQEWLFEEARRGGHEVLIGTTDFTMPLLDEWMEELGTRIRVLFPGREGFRLAYDKAATIKLAEDQGIAVPPTHWTDSQEEVIQLANGGRWPLVIKGRSSVISRDGRRVSAGVEYAFDKREFLEKYREVHALSPWPIVQEYVRGTGMGCFFLRHNGEIMARFQHRRIRDVRPTGSGSSLRESVKPDAALHAGSERLLGAMRWEGLCMAEYRTTAEGTSYLMEVNPRPWGSMQLAVDAGVDFPWLWYRLGVGLPVEPVQAYRAGLRCRNLAGDCKHLESVLYGPPPGWQLPFPGRLPTLIEFLKFWRKNETYEDFAGGDWRPGIAGLAGYFRGLLGRIAGKLRRIRKGER
jgi:predicted ATP-grasp superfamily ATP-dependent carboligase